MLFVARNPARSDCYESKQGWAEKYTTGAAVPRKRESEGIGDLGRHWRLRNKMMLKHG
jgi:hypothetical protein